VSRNPAELKKKVVNYPVQETLQADKSLKHNRFGDRHGGRQAGGNSGEAGADGCKLDDLIRRMRAGDREAAAAFVMRFSSRIRRRIRGKLNPSMRRIFDSQDILSTVGRRLDRFVESGRMDAASEGQLWSLMFTIANNAVVEKCRQFRRLQRLEDADSGFARDLTDRQRRSERRASAAPSIEVEKVISLFDDKIDKQILSLWLSDTRQCDIAQRIDLAPAAVRKRWQKITTRLREKFATELCR
jgi:DNA-directed RNA polymerase specialized sigma24 family protein